MKHISAVVTAVALLAAMPAQAYIGLGPGLSMLGSFFTLCAGVVLSILMVISYPVRLWLYNRRKRKQDADSKP